MMDLIAILPNCRNGKTESFDKTLDAATHMAFFGSMRLNKFPVFLDQMIPSERGRRLFDMLKKWDPRRKPDL